MFGLDFETFSSVDIKKHGLARYIESPDFTVLTASARSRGDRWSFNFVEDFSESKKGLHHIFANENRCAAHNASFERAVCAWLGYDLSEMAFIDTAVISRAMGAGSKLAVAAPQLLSCGKDPNGVALIRTFSVPTEHNQGRPYTWDEIVADDALMQKWILFDKYCATDADRCFDIADQFFSTVPDQELIYEQRTWEMNQQGWFVDLPMVHEMQKRYLRNTAELERKFRAEVPGAADLNLRSYPQLKEFCAERGVLIKSFDQQNVPKMHKKLRDKANDPVLRAKLAGGDVATRELLNGYGEVLVLLELKQELGGSSLAKLQTIIDLTSADGRLRNQYMHIGAAATFRTTSLGVQMQNLPRLPEEPGDVMQLHNPLTYWDNDALAHNLRQVFKAEHPEGLLIVGDFKSVESRGLAYEAGEEWKLEAYRNGKDIYKMLAMSYSSNAGVLYEDVTKKQRQGGKVGELACGYGAGPSAVQSFAEKMGIVMSEEESTQIVVDWRNADPNIVTFWGQLDEMLHRVLDSPGSVSRKMRNGGQVRLRRAWTPESLKNQHPAAQSIAMEILRPDGSHYFTRIFQGCYYRGRDICYYKPSEAAGGSLWRARMTSPPHAYYKLYGGKLAGILTQSFCRELFFSSMNTLAGMVADHSNVKLIGQFHDELVLEWTPSLKADALSLAHAEELMAFAMSDTDWAGFPLEADIKHAHRYIK